MKAPFTVCLTSLVLAFAHSASATNITYTVNDKVGAGSVTGTITTDGVIGTLATSDILSFLLTLDDGTGSAGLNSATNGLVGGSTGSNVTATATGLYFNFNGNGNLLNFYSSETCSPPEWSFETTGSGFGCNGTTGNQEGVASRLPFGSGTYVAESGLVLFAGTNSVSTTPEPESLVLVGSGLLGVVGMIRRRVR